MSGVHDALLEPNPILLDLTPQSRVPEIEELVHQRHAWPIFRIIQALSPGDAILASRSLDTTDLAVIDRRRRSFNASSIPRLRRYSDRLISVTL